MNDVENLPAVSSLHVSDKHTFSKSVVGSIKLIEGFGIEGDCHAGSIDQHRFHLRRFGEQPNLRQVHLIQGELFDELAQKGHRVRAGDLGENITTRNIDLLELPTGTLLRLGSNAIIELTGLRNPCRQIEEFQSGLLDQVREFAPDGLIRKAGVMATVTSGGVVHAGDVIEVELPPLPRASLTYRVPGVR